MMGAADDLNISTEVVTSYGFGNFSTIVPVARSIAWLEMPNELGEEPWADSLTSSGIVGN